MQNLNDTQEINTRDKYSSEQKNRYKIIDLIIRLKNDSSIERLSLSLEFIHSLFQMKDSTKYNFE
jgi:hypothetical protein